MSLYMRQELRMSQQLVMTPQLQQAIKLLQLSRPELSDLVRNELLENPLLEEQQEIGTASTSDEPVSSVEMQDDVNTPPADSLHASPDAEQMEVSAEGKSSTDEFDWEAYIQHQSLSGPAPGSGVRPDADLPSVDQTHSRPESLVEHLMWQVRLSGWSEAEDEIAEYLIRSLSPAGYLHHVTAVQVARTLDASTLTVERVLRRIQSLDPISIGARNLSEALWVQANNPEHPIEDPLVRTLICEHLPDLERRAYNQIARDTGEALEEVYEATKVVMALEPRPARSFVSEEPQYVTPDVYVHKRGDEYVVTLNDDGLPKLRISNYYKAALTAAPKSSDKAASGSGKPGTSGAEAKDYITERLRSAQWLIRSIQQRQRTILKVTRSILKFQTEFFEKGPQHLRPLILRDVAEDIEMHESTVSRVTTNKYVHTQQGIFELKYFFNAGISRRGGGELASEAVKDKIQRLIATEDPRKPHSDQRLVELLRDDGIDIARRTVAKYREQLHLLSSAKRRKFF